MTLSSKFKPHVLPAAEEKLAWNMRGTEQVTLTRNQCGAVLEELERLRNIVAWYQDRDFYDEGPPF